MFRLIRLLVGLLELIESSWDSETERAATYLKKNGRIDLRKSLRKRARLRRNRIFLQILFNFVLVLIAATSGFFIYYFHSIVNTPYDRLVGNQVNTPWWVYLLDIYFVIVAIKALASMNFKRLGNISIVKVSDVINKGFIYALYLRAFQADQNRDSFKEEELVMKLLHSNIVTFTVGMPEEVDASPGAVRIYVANDTWQEDVKSLMEQASFLFLRICDTEPCLWELEQALALPQQLFIIVDNATDYFSVCSKCPKLPMNITPAEGQYEIFERKEDGTWERVNVSSRQKKNSQGERNKERNKRHQYNASMKKAYTQSLLERFQKPENGSIREYENCIDGIFSNMMGRMDQEDTVLVATRILDLIEAYYSFGSHKKRVLNNIRCYLSRLESFGYLTDELKQRMEVVSTNISTQ
jgi:hypothetical protein